MRKIGNREIYAGVILLSSSLLLCTLVILSFVSDISLSNSVTSNELLKRLFGLVLTVLGVRGGGLLLMRKTRGWVISVSLLCFFMLVTGYGFIDNYYLTSSEIGTVAVIDFLLLLSVLFLLSPATRRKYDVNERVIPPILFLTGSMALLYIFIQ